MTTPAIEAASQAVLTAWERLERHPAHDTAGRPVDRDALPRYFWTAIEKLQAAVAEPDHDTELCPRCERSVRMDEGIEVIEAGGDVDGRGDPVTVHVHDDCRRDTDTEVEDYRLQAIIAHDASVGLPGFAPVTPLTPPHRTAMELLASLRADHEAGTITQEQMLADAERVLSRSYFRPE